MALAGIDHIVEVGCFVGVGLGIEWLVEEVHFVGAVAVVWGIAVTGIVVVDLAGVEDLVEETVVMVGSALEGTAVGVDHAEVAEVVEEVGLLLFEIGVEVVLVGVAPLPFVDHLVRNLALMNIAPWMVDLMMGEYGCTCFVGVVGWVDLGMTLVHLMDNLVPWGDPVPVVLERRFLRFDTGGVGLPD